jgi:putative ABC transport system permease protein
VSHGPFDAAFDRAHGAHVTATFGPQVTAAAVAATGAKAGVTAAAGPFDEVTASIAVSGGPQFRAGTIVGRADAGGPVDRLELDAGAWLTGPGQIVLSRDYAGFAADSIGADLTIDLPGAGHLRLVGIADSITDTGDAWVWPSQSDVLTAGGAPPGRQMLYRFASAESATALAAALTTATGALPSGAVTGSSTYLSARLASNRSVAAFSPFIVAFAVLGLVLSVLIVANVVNGAVVSGFRTIGVLKTLGFTPRQVVAVYVTQVLAPAVVGSVVGVGLGVTLAAPLLHDTQRAYNVQASVGGTPIWIMLVVLVGAPLLVALAAVGPALRAGRLQANQAINVGRAPRAGRGFRLRRALTATRLPRSVAFGLGMPAARPLRSIGTVVAIVLGAVTLVFAVGLASSLGRIHDGFSRIAQVPIVLHFAPPGGPRIKPGSPPPDQTPTVGATANPTAVLAAVSTQLGTAHAVRLSDVSVRIAGITKDITVEAYSGDSSWTGHMLISGRWYRGPTEIVASSYLLRQTGHHVGDQLTVMGPAGTRVVTVTGEFLDGQNGLNLIADAGSLSGVTAPVQPDMIEIELRPGISVSSYISALRSMPVLTPDVFVDDRTQDNTEATFAVLDALIATLALLLCTVAALGVLNTVVLNTRERVHEIGVLKSVGMTPRQVASMVVTSMAGLGAIAGLISVPAGVALQHRILPIMADAAGTALPTSIIDVYRTGELLLLGLAGIGVAIIGALLPAGWAARTRPANALRAE